MSQTDNFS
jgi:ariadne-1